MKNFKRRLALVLSIIMMIGAISPICVVNAAESASTSEEPAIVRLESPAIKATVGEVIDLKSYKVEFSATKTIAGKNITWTSSTLTVVNGQVTPDKKGVYEINAVSETFSKVIYLVVKNPEDTEYVLYEENYDSYANGSSWEAVGYRKKSLSSGAFCEIRDGKFVLGGADGDYYVRMYLPEYLSNFQYYKVEYSAAMTKYQKTSRWMALISRAQPSGYPYYQFAARATTTVDNGLELAFRNESDKFDVPYKTSYTSNMSDKAYRTFTVESAGTTVKCALCNRFNNSDSGIS